MLLAFRILEVVGPEQVTRLDLSGWSMRSLEVLAPFVNLTNLNLSGCRSLESLEGLAGCAQLTSVDLNGCVSLESLAGLEGCAKLTSLDLSYCEALPESHQKFWEGDDLQRFLQSLELF